MRRKSPFLTVFAAVIGLGAGVLSGIVTKTLESEHASLSWIADHRFDSYNKYVEADEDFRRIYLDERISTVALPEKIERGRQILFSRIRLSLVGSKDLITSIATFNKIRNQFPAKVEDANDEQKFIYRDAIFAIRMAMRNDLARYYEDIGQIDITTFEAFSCPYYPCLRVFKDDKPPHVINKPAFITNDEWATFVRLLGSPSYYVGSG
jgi:hypothetical protein